MRFIIAFALTALLLASSLYGLILAVDPYNKFGYNLFGFETKAVDFARQNKYNQIEHAKKDYSAFILGSSSAHRYMTQEVNRLTGLVTYNYSTQSGTPEDYIAMTRHVLKHFDVKLILLSIDFEVLNKHTKTDDMFYSSPLKKYLKEVPAEELEADLFNNTYLTLSAINDTFKVIWVNLFGKAEHAYLEHGDHEQDKKPETINMKQFAGGPFEIDQRRVGYLKTMKELSEKHGFKIIVFTSPLSGEHMDRINTIPHLKEANALAKKTLVDIFGELYDFQNEGIKKYDTVDYFNDSNHPSHNFSTLVLERIFGEPDPENPEFGKLIKK